MARRQASGPIGELLLKRKLVRREELDAALAHQAQSPGNRIGEILVELGYLQPSQLTRTLAELYGVPAYEVGTRCEPDAVALIPKDFAEDQLLLPVRLDGDAGDVIVVATPRPDDTELLAFVTERTGKTVSPLVASEAVVRRAIGEAYQTLHAVEQHVAAYRTTAIAATTDDSTSISAVTEDAPVVRIANILVTEALRERASDVHIEPQPDRLRIRYRVDGTLRDVQDLPLEMGPALASRIKVMADLDIIERHRSQDGQMTLEVEGRQVDIRVAITESIWGEKVVLRVLDRGKSVLGVGQLGMPDELVSQYLPVVHIPFGMVCVAGPTGAGKTTTLYASLNELDRFERNITTIEDPVEYIFPDITQIQIHKAYGRDFAHGLRALLRQDPDVILVGEVRDTETAEIATQAALTGHAVFCSVHATDSVAALFRFLDMGVPNYLIAPAMEAIVAQRLVRRICHVCAVEYVPSADELALYEKVTGVRREEFWHGTGCTHCHGTGYYERIGVYEFLRLDDEIKELIVRGATAAELRDAAVKTSGMVPLGQAAMAKVTTNETTISEVIRTVYAAG
ncbi:MAG: GspE/PulE family protein [Acidimicrobiia bacterium]|nr:GspE/PulE family protein [Acidimicrobiia bacterium]